MGMIIGALAIMAIVGRHHRNRRILGQLDQQPVDLFLLGQFVVLNLDVIAVAEDRRVLLDGELGFLVIAVVERLRHFALQTGAQRDQAAVKLPEQFLVDARLIVKPFDVAQGHQLAQIAVALIVHRQENQVVVVFLGPLVDAFFLETAGRRDVDLAADDRLDATALGLAVKFDGAEHIAMIGHRHRRLVERLDALEHLIDLVGAV